MQIVVLAMRRLKCREEIATALNDFGNRWCKREDVADGVLKACKRNIFTIVDKRISFIHKILIFYYIF